MSMVKHIGLGLSRFRHYLGDMRLRFRCRANWFFHKTQYPRRKLLKQEGVIVSLTSYPARFKTLHLTLYSLLMQTTSPEKFILWISHEELSLLPQNVLELTAYGLEIKGCSNYKSYTKLLPALQEYPSYTIITADDDVFYWPTWLSELITVSRTSPKEVLCHRMHKIRLTDAALPRPYQEWHYECRDLNADVLHFPTTGAGVLFPPGVFPPDVFDLATCLSICPSADDIWFYWMARMNGATFRKVPSTYPLQCWRGTEIVSLANTNVLRGGNDRQIKAMIEKYGFFDTPSPLEKEALC